MIVSWNVRGLNKAGKLREISSRLLELQPEIAILIETRVKENKAAKVREKLRLNGNYLDNYTCHANGRLWIHWDLNRVDVKCVSRTSQLIHCGVYDVTGNFKFWLTAIYASNALDRRKILWKDIEKIHETHQGAWCVVGDYNNVAKAQDRIGGKMVTEAEFVDLQNMMDVTGLSEMDSIGDFFTWSNKRSADPIYSRIDRVLANVLWFQENTDKVLNVLPPNVSDHSLLYLNADRARRMHGSFKFNNYMVDIAGFKEVVQESWKQPTKGSPMGVLWHKLERLKQVLKDFNKPANDIKQKIVKARQELHNAQNELINCRFDSQKMEVVKKLIEVVIRWNSMEDNYMMQKAKLDWLKMGDDNSAFFHAYVKTKSKTKSMRMVQTSDGTVLSTQAEIEQEVLEFYGNLMGKANHSLNHIDIGVMRKGRQVNMEQRKHLVSKVTVKEIEYALHGIGDLKAPGEDGYSAKFFEVCWSFIKKDVIAAVMEFFSS